MSLVLLGILNSQVSGGGAGTPAFDFLESSLIGGSTSSVLIDGLDAYSEYNHLQVRMIFRANSDQSIQLQMVDPGGSSHAFHAFTSAGSIRQGNNTSLQEIFRGMSDNTNAGEYAVTILDILDFSSSSKNKTTRWITGNMTDQTNLAYGSGLWADTSPITELLFSGSAGQSILSGSRISIYGRK